MPENVERTQTPDSEPWFIPRSPGALLDLPIAYQWEVTRRHPYYLRYWQLAHRYHQQPSSEPTQRGLEQSAALVLFGIGVTGDPPDPASPQSLGTSALSNAWESGAVAPVTYRGLVGMLLTGLPANVRREVGQLLLASGESTDEPTQRQYADVWTVSQMRDPALDSFPNWPVVGVNLQAPQRVIAQAVEEMVRRWKEEQDIQERRRRDDKLDQYLAIWDGREGWVGDRYEVNREQPLRQIAQEFSMALSTVENHYRSAFRLIVGQDYTPERWMRVLGFWKLVDWPEPDNRPKRKSRRPWRTRQARPVAESVLRAPEGDEGLNRVLNTAGACEAEIEYVEFLSDIQELIRLGRSNTEIVVEMQLSRSTADALIDHLRQREQDRL
jgi:hypothetical protein